MKNSAKPVETRKTNAQFAQFLRKMFGIAVGGKVAEQFGSLQDFRQIAKGDASDILRNKCRLCPAQIQEILDLFYD